MWFKYFSLIYYYSENYRQNIHTTGLSIDNCYTFQPFHHRFLHSRSFICRNLEYGRCQRFFLDSLVNKTQDLGSYSDPRYRGGSGPNDPGGSRSIFPLWGQLNLRELPDYAILLPQTLRTPCYLLA